MSDAAIRQLEKFKEDEKTNPIVFRAVGRSELLGSGYSEERTKRAIQLLNVRINQMWRELRGRTEHRTGLQ